MSEISRSTVLLAGDDTDHDVGVALGLDSIPGDGMTLGDLVDEANQTRGDLERLICAVTGGAMSKARWAEDTDVVMEKGDEAFLNRLADACPAILDCAAFRDWVVTEHGGAQLEELDAVRRLAL